MRRGPASAVLLLALAACNNVRPVATPSPTVTPSATPTPSATTASPTVTPSVSASASATAVACRTAYAAPDPNRPVVRLAWDVAANHGSVAGSQHVVFTPDRAVDRLVFRLWPNNGRAAAGGSRLVVAEARVDGARAQFRTSQGSTQLTIPLGRVRNAGTKVTVDLTYQLTLPSGINDRYGHNGGTAWFATAHPLLAWERGVGWAEQPPTTAFAEATASEAFRLEKLTVKVPAGDVVLATGVGDATNGFRADAVRDVAVMVGRFKLARRNVDGVPLTVGVAPGMEDDAGQIADLHVRAMREHIARFGPFPYRDLDVAIVPDVGGGIEYPGAIINGTRQLDATLSHEVAHQWFYGLVGNNQARDPWLDEGFATYAEALDRQTGDSYRTMTIPASGRDRVGAPMSYWENHQNDYFRSVYIQGAVSLLRARDRVGATAFDRAIRCYVAANAHRIARPRDLTAALRHLPGAVAILRADGALPR